MSNNTGTDIDPILLNFLNNIFVVNGFFNEDNDDDVVVFVSVGDCAVGSFPTSTGSDGDGVVVVVVVLAAGMVVVVNLATKYCQSKLQLKKEKYRDMVSKSEVANAPIKSVGACKSTPVATKLIIPPTYDAAINPAVRVAGWCVVAVTLALALVLALAPNHVQ